MRIASVSWLAIAGCLLATMPTIPAAQQLDRPVWVEPEARSLAASPAVKLASEALLEQTLEGADARQLVSAIGRLRADVTLTPVQRDAALSGYVARLRELSPGSAPQAVLDRLAEAEPLAVTGHEEGDHHPVPVFNVAASALGLANEWAWRRGHDDTIGSDPLPVSALAGELGALSPDSPRYRGIRAAIERLPTERLEALATQCASRLDGCGEARADIELARGNVRWLGGWITGATPRAVLPRLQRLRSSLPASDAGVLMEAALAHPDPGVAAWAMSDLTVHLPGDDSGRREWGNRLVGLLDDPDLGGAAALQLARMDGEGWLEAAAAQVLKAPGRRRLELLAELETAVRPSEPESESGP